MLDIMMSKCSLAVYLWLLKNNIYLQPSSADIQEGHVFSVVRCSDIKLTSRGCFGYVCNSFPTESTSAYKVLIIGRCLYCKSLYEGIHIR